MPRLILLRHAKAEAAEHGGAGDHERVLSNRGVRDAAAAGQQLAARYGRVETVLCSTSTRTRQTWEGVRPALQNPPEPVFLREIYDAGRDYLDILRGQGGTASLLLLVGHNPTIQATALLLASPESGGSVSSRFPTSAFAVLDFDGAWDALQPGVARLTDFVVPGGAQ